MRTLLTLTALALPLVFAGCGSSSAVKSGPAPFSTQQNNWKVYASKDGGYKVSFPSNWVTVDAKSLASHVPPAFSSSNPQLKSQLATFRATASKPGTIMGIDNSPGGKKVIKDNRLAVNIILRRIPAGSSVPDATILSKVKNLATSSAANLPGMKTSGFTSGTMGGSPSVSGTFTFNEALPGRTLRATERDEFMVKDGAIYSVSCADTAADYPRLDQICNRVIATFSLNG
jgi:hypothetical protein